MTKFIFCIFSLITTNISIINGIEKNINTTNNEYTNTYDHKLKLTNILYTNSAFFSGHDEFEINVDVNNKKLLVPCDLNRKLPYSFVCNKITAENEIPYNNISYENDLLPIAKSLRLKEASLDWTDTITHDSYIELNGNEKQWQNIETKLKFNNELKLNKFNAETNFQINVGIDGVITKFNNVLESWKQRKINLKNIEFTLDNKINYIQTGKIFQNIINSYIADNIYLLNAPEDWNIMINTYDLNDKIIIRNYGDFSWIYAPLDEYSNLETYKILKDKKICIKYTTENLVTHAEKKFIKYITVKELNESIKITKTKNENIKIDNIYLDDYIDENTYIIGQNLNYTTI